MMQTSNFKQQDAGRLVNLSRYPISSMDSPQGTEFALLCQQAYRETGLCLLPDFITEAAIEQFTHETNDFLQDAYFCDSTHNAYLTTKDSAVAEDDLLNHQEKTVVGSVPYDKIDPTSQLNRLYQWQPLMDFIAIVLDKPRLFRFADPFGALSINVFTEGGKHGWHFDEAEFTVTLMLQRPEIGGAFEYLPKIRGRANEAQRVRDALHGKRDGIEKLPFTAGTLLIFGGNQTLHRVTEVGGATPRLVPIFCYCETENQTNSEAVRQLFWGRSGPDDPMETTPP